MRAAATLAAALFLGLADAAIAEAEPAATTSQWWARRLIERGSMEPVVLGMRTNRMVQPNGLPLTVDAHISFRFPAAAFNVVDLNGPSQRLGVQLWSRTLDPVRPDVDADLAACPRGDEHCRRFGPPNSRVLARRQAGEYILRVEVTSVLFSEERRHSVLWWGSGMESRVPDRSRGPCSFQYDETIGMLATDRPREQRAASACNIIGYLGPDGTGRYSPRNFLKLEPDATPRFVVRCPWYAWEPTTERPWFCELQGYLGIWPLFLWVTSDSATQWNETFLRVRDHLSRHVVGRSDPNP